MSDRVAEANNIRIQGGQELSGEIEVQGSKNSFHKIVAACVRWPGEFALYGVPDIQDAAWLLEQFQYVGGTVAQDNGVTLLNSESITPKPIGRELTSRSRGSFLFAGGLLGRFGEAEIGLPGGDQVGPRPVNYTLDAFRALGAQVTEGDDTIRLTARKLTGGQFTFPCETVGGTINTILAASGCEEGVELRNCAYDSDVEDAIKFMNALGNRVVLADQAAGIIHVEPGEPKRELSFRLESDQPATATYAVAGALAGQDLLLTNVNIAGTEPLWKLLSQIGAEVTYSSEERWAKVSRREFNSLPETIKSAMQPAISTDWGPQLQVLLTQLKGGGTFHEGVFVNRFAHVPELAAMGAEATLRETDTGLWVPGTEWSKQSAYDRCTYMGPTELVGARIRANDIRNGAALVLAGLIANGETIVSEAMQVRRGYEDMVATYKRLGADISWSGAEIFSATT